MADQLATLADIKTSLKISNVTDDAFLTDLLEDVSDWIQEYTGRKLVPEPAATYIVDTAWGSEIFVRRGIRAVTALGIATSTQPDTGGTYTAVTLTDVLIRPSSIERKPGWPGTSILLAGSSARLRDCLNGATITGDFGFAATPGAIQRVTIDAVKAAFVDRRAGGSGVVGADESASYPWASYFAWGSPQRQTLMRFRAGGGMGIA